MDSGFLDVFHDPADIDICAVTQRVDIDLDGIVQEPVNQHRIVAGDDDRIAHIALQIGQVMHHFHGPATKHI